MKSTKLENLALSKSQSASRGIAVEIASLSKWYEDFKVLSYISLTVMEGERIVIVGPFGSRKSTLIRCINRLEDHQKGGHSQRRATYRKYSTYPRNAARCRDGVPAIQSFPSPNNPRKLHAAAYLGKKNSAC